MRRALLLLGLVLAAQPAAGQPAAAQPIEGHDIGAHDIAGTWFGERWTGALLIQHLSQRAPDGRLEVRFRFLRGCAMVGGEEQEGHWLREGNAFHAWSERVDGGPARPDGSSILFSHSIDALSEDRITYRHIASARVHRAFRVPAAFRLPPPIGCKVTS